MQDKQRSVNTSGKFIEFGILLYQVLALASLLLGLLWSFQWLRLPFIGGFVEHTLVFNGVGSYTNQHAWGLYYQDIGFGNQLKAIAGTEVHSADDMSAVLSTFFPGETVAVDILLTNGETRTFPVMLQPFPANDQTLYLYVPLLVGVIFMAISLWIFGFRRSEIAGRAFSLFGASIAIISGTLFNVYTTHQLTYVWTLALGVVSGSLVDMALSFPQQARILRKRPYLRSIGYIVGGVLSVYAFFFIYNAHAPTYYLTTWQFLYGFVVVSFLFFLGQVIFRGMSTRSPIIRNQSQTILLGSLAAFGPLAIWLGISLTAPVNFTPYLLLPMILFPVAVGYTIMRFRLLQADYLLTQTILYASLSVVAVGGFALVITGLSMIFSEILDLASPILIGVVIFFMLVALNPLRTRLQQVIDGIFFRGQTAYQSSLQEFSHELTNTINLRLILDALRQHINQMLFPSLFHIYIYDPLNDQYTAANTAEDGRPTSDVRFSANSALTQLLHRERIPLYIDESTIPAVLQSEKNRLSLLGAHLFVPMDGTEKPIGWMALGPKKSGQIYTSQELNFIENMSAQAALAIERAQVVANLERRVQEMNALTRVAQGVNITLNFDDILELIFAQTTLIIPASDLHITLHNQAGNYHYYAFCIENNDRLTQQENHPLPSNQGLSSDIIQSGRPILTQDYVRECQNRKTSPAINGLYAWMGVPLNAGADTIGALSIGSRDPGSIYTRAQLNLLQAIADQTAGAIVKSRLLQESEQRARQLSTLNDITRQLTSTLELDPLLQNMLENAVKILNAEAGSLFLTEEESDDLIFKVTVGPVASDLLGQRIPGTRGIVGQVIESRMPVIENDAQNAPARFTAADEQTGFTTHSILAVPLEVKEHIIGVIEVINRRDGLPFTNDDQNLLTAFAGQAAVAIENARLYTTTDQQLAARVEELSVMQRIDRELNASLEVHRAMRITLDWAMRQSKAHAGIVGVIEDKGLRIMALQGFDEENNLSDNTYLPIDHPGFLNAIETGQSQWLDFDPVNNGHGSFLPGTRSQVIVPIRREAKVIGLLLLESKSSEEKEDLSFLNRLSDHAAIAISNAQLYAEVEAANIAKSDFVSFVAHELKNPMTSIKGYTELLSGGAVGQINEMQSNFLQTIRSNVERMSTLVSDLNDNSKIEIGRLRLDFKAVHPKDIIEDAIRSASRQLDEKKQSISTNLPASLPAVWGDPTRLGQILVNLVSNANKYTPEGGQIIIGAAEAKNQWDPEGAERVVHIWVKDNGIGIALDDQKKIFQKFFRSDDQKARESSGTGLGLNITKSLIEMQGGSTWFESEFRKGTTFHFTIPVAEE